MTPMPEQTRPKIVCLPSSHGVGASVMKNCKCQGQVNQGGTLASGTATSKYNATDFCMVALAANHSDQLAD